MIVFNLKLINLAGYTTCYNFLNYYVKNKVLNNEKYYSIVAHFVNRNLV